MNVVRALRCILTNIDAVLTLKLLRKPVGKCVVVACPCVIAVENANGSRGVHIHMLHNACIADRETCSTKDINQGRV